MRSKLGLRAEVQVAHILPPRVGTNGMHAPSSLPMSSWSARWRKQGLFSPAGQRKSTQALHQEKSLWYARQDSNL